MSAFFVKPDRLVVNARNMSGHAGRVNDYVREMGMISAQLKHDQFNRQCAEKIDGVIVQADAVKAGVLSCATGLEQIAGKYKSAEMNVKAYGNTSTGENSSGTGTDGEAGKPARDYSGWGTEPGTILPVEYAYLTQYAYRAGAEPDEEAMRRKFIECLKELPEGHPLRDVENVRAMRIGTNKSCEVFVIEMDPDHAIVVFPGTNIGQGDDIATDLGIVGDVIPGIQSLTAAGRILDPVEWITENQFEAANRLISELPYSNISVTGHSLGGHLAADVTLNSTKITECVTFDPPGRGDTWMRTLFDPGDRVSKITNYCARGSVVSGTGAQIGNVVMVDVNPNVDSILPNHDLQHIIDDALGGMEAVAGGHFSGGGGGGGGASGR